MSSESELTDEIRLEAAQKNVHLWRNNLGATYSPHGGFIRYGLANDSAHVNRVLKSGDLIGIRPIIITPEMVGAIIGQFISREVKNRDWKFSGTDREKAQQNWIDLINRLGGDACFVNSRGSFDEEKISQLGMAAVEG